jgi:hypothetical protein
MNKTFAVYIDSITARFGTEEGHFIIGDSITKKEILTVIKKIIRDENNNRTILFVEPIGEIPPDFVKDVIVMENFEDVGGLLSPDLLEFVDGVGKKAG